jgi:uncharacterized membrane protein
VKRRTKSVALISLYAALYVALVLVFGGISYGPVQIRVADVMVALVPLLGLPGVLGHTLGVFIGNIPSSAGPVDLLNAIPSFVMAFLVYYVYRRTGKDYTIIGTCLAYSVVLGVTVGWMLSALFGFPLVVTIIYVALGNVIATVLIGWPLFKLLKKTDVFKRWLG